MSLDLRHDDGSGLTPPEILAAIGVGVALFLGAFFAIVGAIAWVLG